MIMGSCNQQGQIVIIALLVMVVVLAVGLSVVGRSISEISTSTKVEDSTRAFSAAEAGIEKVLQMDPGTSGNVGVGGFTNQAQASVDWNAGLPDIGKALEYPLFGKESYAQFWLTNPATMPSSGYYKQNSFSMYFGVPKDYSGNEDEKPGIEVKIITKNNSGYSITRRLFDSASPARVTTGDFLYCEDGGASPTGILIPSLASGRLYYCKVTVRNYCRIGGDVCDSSVYPVMARVRILYSNAAQPVALQPVGTCGQNCSLPPQAKVFTSVGSVGDLQRTVQVFQQKSVMPHLFDYVLFAASEVDK